MYYKLVMAIVFLCAHSICYAQPSFTLKYESGKTAVIGAEGDYVSKPKYTYIGPSEVDGYYSANIGAVVIKNYLVGGYWGLLDSHGNEVVSPAFTVLKVVNDSLCMAKFDGHCSVLNFKRDVVYETDYHDIGLYCGKYFKVCTDGKWGIIDDTAGVVVQPSYDLIKKDTLSSLFVVERNEKKGLLDECGKIIIEPRYDFISHVFDDGTIIVNSNGMADIYGRIRGGDWLCFDKSGNQLDTSALSPKLPVKIAAYNKILIKRVKERKAKSGHDGVTFALVNMEANQGDSHIYVNEGGKKDRSTGIIEGGKWGVADKNKKLLTEIKYDYIAPYVGGMAAVNIGGHVEAFFTGGKWGFVDEQGKEAVPIKYDNVSHFSSDGFAIYYMGNTPFAVDKTGKELTIFEASVIIFNRDRGAVETDPLRHAAISERLPADVKFSVNDVIETAIWNY